jgi:hypothetical protein
MSLADGAAWEADFGWPQQPAPKQNEHPACWDLVLGDIEKADLKSPSQAAVHALFIQDCHKRDSTGHKKYGVRLQPFNGRNAMQDAYEEMIDGIVYVRGEIYEQKTKVGLIITQESEFVLKGLYEVYNALINNALILRFLLERQKQQGNKITE